MDRAHARACCTSTPPPNTGREEPGLPSGLLTMRKDRQSGRVRRPHRQHPEEQRGAGQLRLRAPVVVEGALPLAFSSSHRMRTCLGAWWACPRRCSLLRARSTVSCSTHALRCRESACWSEVAWPQTGPAVKNAGRSERANPALRLSCAGRICSILYGVQPAGRSTGSTEAYPPREQASPATVVARDRWTGCVPRFLWGSRERWSPDGHHGQGWLSMLQR